MQGLNPGLLHCRRILYHLSHQRSSVSATQQSKIGHNYAYIPSFLSLPPLAPPLPSRSTEHQAGLPVLYSNFSPAICFTHVAYIYVNASFSIHPILSFPPCVHKSFFFSFLHYRQVLLNYQPTCPFHMHFRWVRLLCVGAYIVFDPVLKFV